VSAPPVVTFPAALPRIPYGGFSPVRLPAPGTVQFGRGPSRCGRPLKSDPDIPGHHTGLPTPSRALPPEGNSATEDRAWTAGDPTWALRSSLRQGYSVPAIDAWRPHPPVWFLPSHFPAEPVIGSVFGIPESPCLIVHLLRLTRRLFFPTVRFSKQSGEGKRWQPPPLTTPAERVHEDLAGGRKNRLEASMKLIFRNTRWILPSVCVALLLMGASLSCAGVEWLSRFAIVLHRSDVLKCLPRHRSAPLRQ
jgi:hypothetical protein